MTAEAEAPALAFTGSLFRDCVTARLEVVTHNALTYLIVNRRS
jgi:hypothetical protein